MREYFSMMGRNIARWSGLISSCIVLCGLMTLPAAAATTTVPGPGNGLKVSPVTTNLTVNPGESQTVQVYVQNVTTSTVELQAIINDFVAGSGESGAPALLLNNDFAPSHSLKRYIAAVPNVTLNPGEQKVVNVVVAIPKNAPGGGYYGAVRFASAGAGGSSNVTLSASVGSLILVRVPGTYKEQMRLTSFDIRTTDNDSPRVVFTSNANIEVAARFENLGDIQEQPFGKVLLKPGSTSYELNDTTPRGNVLPGSVRRFNVKLDKVGAFGRYTVSGNFGYGSSGQLLTAETTFYVVPVALIVAGVVALGLLLFVIFGLPRMIRAYNRRVVERSRR